MTIEPFQPEFEEPLLRLLNDAPDQDRNFFKVDVSDTEALQRWLNEPRTCRFVARNGGGEIVGEVAVIRGLGWSAHVGELELIVAPTHRRKSYGRKLAQRALGEAVQLGLTHIFVQVAAEQFALVSMFQEIGFEPEALLRDFICDRGGESHDLIILTHRVEQTWSELLTLGIDEDVEMRA
jgi:ribosomal protein S18 acetylase RimI-like enzyme